MSRYARKLAEVTITADQDDWSVPHHGDLQQLADDVFFVRGRMSSTPARPLFERMFLHYSRTMTIVRGAAGHDVALHQVTLINTMRLGAEGLSQLEALGEISDVVRLGSFHGVDDAFYLRRYPQARYWHVSNMCPAANVASVPRVLSSDLPLPGVQVHVFRNVNFPEAVLVLPPTEKRSGVAITTDSVQNHSSVFDKDNSWMVSCGIWWLGLVGKARLGPYWMDQQVPRGQKVAVLRPQYEELLENYDWDMLVPGHGWPMAKDAKNAVRGSVNAQLPKAKL